MPDRVAAMFRGAWRLELPDGPVGLLGVIQLQAAWRALSQRSRVALLGQVEGDGDARVHPLTLRTLVRHGLIAQSGEVTAVGRAVVQHRPRPEPVDIDLPGGEQ